MKISTAKNFRLASMTKSILSIVMLAFCLVATASQIQFAFTNANNQPDMNSFLVYQVGNPVSAGGGITTVGLAQRYYPNTNGIVLTNMFAPGNYLATNALLGQGIVFRCLNDSSTNIWLAFQGPPGGLAISGYNVFNTGFFTADAIAYLTTNYFGGNTVASSNYLYFYASTNWLPSASSNTNYSLLIGGYATNYANLIGAASTNLSTAASNGVMAASGLAATNYALQLGQQATNQTLLIGALSTNLTMAASNNIFTALLLATNANYAAAVAAAQAFTLSIGVNETNFARLTGLGSTNYSLVIGQAATNAINAALITGTNGLATSAYVLLIGGYETNYANLIGAAATNYALAIGYSGTNNVLNVSNLQSVALIAATNNAAAYARTIGLNGTNNVIASGAVISNALVAFAISTTNGFTGGSGGGGSATNAFGVATNIASTGVSLFVTTNFALAFNTVTVPVGLGYASSNAGVITIVTTNLAGALTNNISGQAAMVSAAVTNKWLADALSQANTVGANTTNFVRDAVALALTNGDSQQWSNSANTIVTIGLSDTEGAVRLAFSPGPLGTFQLADGSSNVRQRILSKSIQFIDELAVYQLIISNNLTTIKNVNVTGSLLANGSGLTNLAEAALPNPLFTNTSIVHYIWTNAASGTYLAWKPGVGLVESNAITGYQTLLVGTNGGIHAGGWSLPGPGNITADNTNTAGYFVGNGSLVTNLNAAQLATGIMPMGRLTASGTNLSNGVLITDGSGNRFWTNAITVSSVTANNHIGNGAGLTNTAAYPVNNVMLFGATGTNNWPLDTAAFQSAFLAMMRTNGYPVYFPNGIFGISNLVIDGAIFNYVTNSAEFSGVKIIGNFGFSQLVPIDAAHPIITVTNALNNVRLESLSFNGLGRTVSAVPMIIVNSTNGLNGSTDAFIMKDCFLQNSWLPFEVQSLSDSHFENCSIALNRRAGWFRKNPLPNLESNNNDFFLGGFIGSNNEGLLVDDGAITFFGVEGGAVGQTNFITLTNTTSATIEFIGGNIELDYGAIITCSNQAGFNLAVNHSRFASANNHNPYLVDYQTTGAAVGTTVNLVSYQSMLPIRLGTFATTNNLNFKDASPSPTVQVENPGKWTNYMGSFRTEETSLGDLTPGTSPKNFNTIFTVRDEGGANHYSETYLGALSNNIIWNIDLLKYWKDAAAGAVARANEVGSSNFFSGDNVFGSVRKTKFLTDGSTGVWLQNTAGAKGVAWINNTFNADDWGFFVAPSGNTQPTWNTAAPRFYHDTGNNRTTIGATAIGSSAPAGLATLNVNGTFTATGTMTGDGSGLTNLPAANISHAVIQTNFISGKSYVNSYGTAITVSGSVSLNVTATAGGASNMSLRSDAAPANGGWTNQYALSTTALSVVMNYTNSLSLVVPTNANFTFTNLSTGGLNSSAVLGGQITY